MVKLIESSAAITSDCRFQGDTKTATPH